MNLVLISIVSAITTASIIISFAAGYLFGFRDADKIHREARKEQEGELP